MRLPRQRPALRTRITFLFASGALLLAVIMAVGTYFAARNYLIGQRETVALRQAFADAAYIRDGLLTSGADVSAVLGTVSPPADAAVVVGRGGRWFSSSLDVGESDVPNELRKSVSEGSVALSWRVLGDTPAIVVGVPLPAVDAQFFGFAATRELNRTLAALRVVLTAFAVVIALAGAALGRWAARRVVAPLDQVAGAAALIAAGALDTRLDATDDRDLITIVASFNSMVDAVNDRIARDARFAADVSHELRSPLTALITSVDVLQRDRDGLSARGQQALELIGRDLERFQRALEDLLALGRLQAGAGGLVLATADARDCVLQALEEAGHGPDVLELPDDVEASTIVRVDKARLHRALVNLFENADRHGRGLARVIIGAEPGRVTITVDDEGPGVPLNERERIFEPFVRGGSRGSLPGTGLGLSLVAETVRVHGGAVWCADRPGGTGARFIVQLPPYERRKVAA